MTLAGFVIRWVHLVACLSLVGTAVAVLLAGRTDRHTAGAWHERMPHFRTRNLDTSENLFWG